MIKEEELSNPRSCLNRARPDEFVFTLLERDKAAPETIRFWVKVRLALGLNKPGDSQIEEALAAADQIESRQTGGLRPYHKRSWPTAGAR